MKVKMASRLRLSKRDYRLLVLYSVLSSNLTGLLGVTNTMALVFRVIRSLHC